MVVGRREQRHGEQHGGGGGRMGKGRRKGVCGVGHVG